MSIIKVNIPRNDVSVTVAGVKTPTPFGFGGWVAMTKGDGEMNVLMGDLVHNPLLLGMSPGCATCTFMPWERPPRSRRSSSQRWR